MRLYRRYCRRRGQRLAAAHALRRSRFSYRPVRTHPAALGTQRPAPRRRPRDRLRSLQRGRHGRGSGRTSAGGTRPGAGRTTGQRRPPWRGSATDPVRATRPPRARCPRARRLEHRRCPARTARASFAEAQQSAGILIPGATARRETAADRGATPAQRCVVRDAGSARKKNPRPTKCAAKTRGPTCIARPRLPSRSNRLDTPCTSGHRQLVDNRRTDPATPCAARSTASRSSPGARREPAPPQEFTA